MPHTYRYLLNPNNERFDLSKIELPSHIGTWPPHADDNPIRLGLISGGEIQSGIDAVREVYPNAEIVDAHGGTREGAGRKPLTDEPTESSRITMPASYWQYVKELGNGNASAGIRKLIEASKPR